MQQHSKGCGTGEDAPPGPARASTPGPRPPPHGLPSRCQRGLLSSARPPGGPPQAPRRRVPLLPACEGAEPSPLFT